MQLIDIGANLTHESFRHDLDAVLERARLAGVVQMVVTGTSEAESVQAHELARRHPRRMFSTAGLHPHLARDWSDATGRRFEELAARPGVVALGEMGLDFNRDFSPRAEQEAAFEAQLELAAALGRPAFLHVRDAHERFAAILSRYRDRLPRAVVHCFTGTGAELDAYLEMDLHIGITGWICDERRGGHLHALVSRIPTERLMIETDSPYLLPRNLRPRPKSRRNEPAYLPRVLQTLAECHGLDPARLAQTTTATARAFFGLPLAA